MFLPIPNTRYVVQWKYCDPGKNQFIDWSLMSKCGWKNVFSWLYKRVMVIYCRVVWSLGKLYPMPSLTVMMGNEVVCFGKKIHFPPDLFIITFDDGNIHLNLFFCARREKKYCDACAWYLLSAWKKMSQWIEWVGRKRLFVRMKRMEWIFERGLVHYNILTSKFGYNIGEAQYKVGVKWREVQSLTMADKG